MDSGCEESEVLVQRRQRSGSVPKVDLVKAVRRDDAVGADSMLQSVERCMTIGPNHQGACKASKHQKEVHACIETVANPTAVGGGSGIWTVGVEGEAYRKVGPSVVQDTDGLDSQ